MIIEMDLFFTLLVLYIFSLLFISWWANRNNTSEDYLIAGRNRPAWQIMFSKYAASIAAGWLIVYTSFAYEYGLGVMVVFVGSVIGSLLYARWAAPRIYPVANEFKCYTHSDFVFALTKSQLAKTITNILAISMSMMVMIVAAVGGATLLEIYSSLTYEAALFLTVGVVLGYILLSGYRAVMLTDILQGALLIVLLSIIALSLLIDNPVPVSSFLEIREISWLGLSMLAVFGFVSLFADPNRYQVGFSASSSKALSKGMYHTIIPFLYTGVVLFCIGVVMYGVDKTLTGAEVFPQAIFSYAPSVLIPFGLLVFFVAIMSSMDSFIYLIATHVEDLVHKKITKNGTRVYVVLVSLLIGLLALRFRDVVDLTIVSAALLFTLALPMIYLIAYQTKAGRFIGMTVGGVVGMFIGMAVIGLEPDAAVFVIIGNLAGTGIPPKLFTRFA